MKDDHSAPGWDSFELFKKEINALFPLMDGIPEEYAKKCEAFAVGVVEASTRHTQDVSDAMRKDFKDLETRIAVLTSRYDQQVAKMQDAKNDSNKLEARCDRAERIVNEIWEMFYGQGMELTNWHLNGDTQPIDSFFEDNDWSIEKEDG